MNTHVYVPSLQILLYQHNFFHIYYVKVAILNLLGCDLCSHTATASALNSDSADGKQLMKESSS